MIKRITKYRHHPSFFLLLILTPFLLYFSEINNWYSWLMASLLVILTMGLISKSLRSLAIIYLLYFLVFNGTFFSKPALVHNECHNQIDYLTGVLKSNHPNSRNEIQLIDNVVYCREKAVKIDVVQIKVSTNIIKKIKWIRSSDTIELRNFKLGKQTGKVLQILPNDRFRIYNITARDRILARSSLLLYVQKKAEYYMDPFVSGIYKAIVTADKSDLTRSVKDRIRAMGIAHIFAISGLHIGIIYFWVTLILKFILFLPVRFSNSGLKILIIDFIAVFLIYGYIQIVGSPVSATRALVMLCWWLMTKHWFPWQPLHFVLMGTAALILMQNPMIIGTLSFQLSFISVLGIVMILPLLPVKSISDSFYSKLFKNIISTFLISVWLFIINLPLISEINAYFAVTNIISNTIHVLFLGGIFLPVAIVVTLIIVLSYPFYGFFGEFYTYTILNIIGKIWQLLLNWSYSWHKFLWWEFSGSWQTEKRLIYWGVLGVTWFFGLYFFKNTYQQTKSYHKPNSAKS